MTANEIGALGPGLTALMASDQLEAAALLFSTISSSTCAPNINSLQDMRTVFMNHMRGCIRMPHGGAGAGGSQQTGFEMEMITATGASALFAGWPNHETELGGRKQSWELRSMQDLADMLHFETAPWGVWQGRPMPLVGGRTVHMGVLMVAPPLTVTFSVRSDRTTSTAVRFPLILWGEDDSVILPPDDSAGNPFYVDPPTQPGLHRDIFKTWGRRIAGELATRDFPMSAAVMSHLPIEYLSDSSALEFDDERSRSSWASSMDSSDLEGAHDTPQDSSDEEGAHQPPRP